MNIFIDANIILHFQPLDQVNWKEIVGTDSVTIFITKSVLRELDKHKRNTNSRISKRAKEFLKRIEASCDFSINVKIQVLTTKNDLDILNEFGLDPSEQDDVLQGSIHKYSRDNKSSEVRLLTDDSGLRISATAAGIKVVTLPEKYAITEIDESSKEIAQLKKELAKLQNRQPNLKVTFIDDLEFCEIQITKPNFEKFKKKKLQDAAIQHPELKEYSYSVANNKLNSQQIDKYNILRTQYLQNYQDYLNKIEHIHIREVLSFPLQIKIRNDGTSPAQSVTLTLKFPTFMTIHHELNLDWPPHMPLPPNITFQNIYHGGFTENLPNPFGVAANYRLNRPGTPEISGNQITLNLDSLRHKESFLMDRFFVTLNNFETANSFRIEYTLHADNIVDKIYGTLNVKLNKLDE